MFGTIFNVLHANIMKDTEIEKSIQSNFRGLRDSSKK